MNDAQGRSDLRPARRANKEQNRMSILDQPNWALVAMATPILLGQDGAIAPDVARMTTLAKDVMAAGCNGVVPFGTTGEGPCYSVAQRCETVDGLIAGGIDRERIIVGVGATAMADMVALAKHATALNCPVLVPPPFYMRIGGPDGIVKAFTQFVGQVADPALKVLIYNIPQVSGFPIPVETMQTLAEEFPGVVVGVKDSCDTWPPVETVVRGRGTLKVCVGAEEFIPKAMALGGCGTICGLSNLAPNAVARTVAGDAAAADGLAKLARMFAGRSFLPTLKAAMAVMREDDAWRNPTPPIEPAADADVADVVAQARTLQD